MESTSADSFVQQLMAEHRIPGLAVGVQKADQLVYEGYFGHANLEHNVPVRAETVFEIASVTKLFTSQAILRLAQKGQLRLDDPLSAYLASIPRCLATGHDPTLSGAPVGNPQLHLS